MITKAVPKEIDALPNTLSYQSKNISIEDIIELRGKKLSYSQIGKVLGCSKQAIGGRLKKIGVNLERAEAYGKNKSAYLNYKQWMLLNSVDEAAVKEMHPYQRIVSASILYDKQRLEDNRSTANVSVRDMSAQIDDTNRQIDNLINILDTSPIVDNFDNNK